jgi:hypothetical protein
VDCKVSDTRLKVSLKILLLKIQKCLVPLIMRVIDVLDLA